jgi:hypothetical protein
MSLVNKQKHFQKTKTMTTATTTTINITNVDRMQTEDDEDNKDTSESESENFQPLSSYIENVVNGDTENSRSSIAVDFESLGINEAGVDGVGGVIQEEEEEEEFVFTPDDVLKRRKMLVWETKRKFDHYAVAFNMNEIFNPGAMNFFDTKQSYTEMIKTIFHILDTQHLFSTEMFGFVEKKINKFIDDHFDAEDIDDRDETEQPQQQPTSRQLDFTNYTSEGRRDGSRQRERMEQFTSIEHIQTGTDTRCYIQGVSGEFGKTYIIHIFIRKTEPINSFKKSILGCFNKVYKETFDQCMDDMAPLYSNEVFTRKGMNDSESTEINGNPNDDDDGEADEEKKKKKPAERRKKKKVGDDSVFGDTTSKKFQLLLSHLKKYFCLTGENYVTSKRHKLSALMKINPPFQMKDISFIFKPETAMKICEINGGCNREMLDEIFLRHLPSMYDYTNVYDDWELNTIDVDGRVYSKWAEGLFPHLSSKEITFMEAAYTCRYNTHTVEKLKSIIFGSTTPNIQSKNILLYFEKMTPIASQLKIDDIFGISKYIFNTLADVVRNKMTDIKTKDDFAKFHEKEIVPLVDTFCDFADILYRNPSETPMPLKALHSNVSSRVLEWFYSNRTASDLKQYVLCGGNLKFTEIDRWCVPIYREDAGLLSNYLLSFKLHCVNDLGVNMKHIAAYQYIAIGKFSQYSDEKSPKCHTVCQGAPCTGKSFLLEVASNQCIPETMTKSDTLGSKHAGVGEGDFALKNSAKLMDETKLSELNPFKDDEQIQKHKNILSNQTSTHPMYTIPENKEKGKKHTVAAKVSTPFTMLAATNIVRFLKQNHALYTRMLFFTFLDQGELAGIEKKIAETMKRKLESVSLIHEKIKSSDTSFNEIQRDMEFLCYVYHTSVESGFINKDTDRLFYLSSIVKMIEVFHKNVHLFEHSTRGNLLCMLGLAEQYAVIEGVLRSYYKPHKDTSESYKDYIRDTEGADFHDLGCLNEKNFEFTDIRKVSNNVTMSPQCIIEAFCNTYTTFFDVSSDLFFEYLFGYNSEILPIIPILSGTATDIIETYPNNFKVNKNIQRTTSGNDIPYRIGYLNTMLHLDSYIKGRWRQTNDVNGLMKSTSKFKVEFRLKTIGSTQYVDLNYITVSTNAFGFKSNTTGNDYNGNNTVGIIAGCIRDKYTGIPRDTSSIRDGIESLSKLMVKPRKVFKYIEKNVFDNILSGFQDNIEMSVGRSNRQSDQRLNIDVFEALENVFFKDNFSELYDRYTIDVDQKSLYTQNSGEFYDPANGIRVLDIPSGCENKIHVAFESIRQYDLLKNDFHSLMEGVCKNTFSDYVSIPTKIAISNPYTGVCRYMEVKSKYYCTIEKGVGNKKKLIDIQLFKLTESELGNTLDKFLSSNDDDYNDIDNDETISGNKHQNIENSTSYMKCENDANTFKCMYNTGDDDDDDDDDIDDDYASSNFYFNCVNRLSKVDINVTQKTLSMFVNRKKVRDENGTLVSFFSSKDFATGASGLFAAMNLDSNLINKTF